MYVKKASDKRKKLKHGNKYKKAKSDHSNILKGSEKYLGCQ